MVKVLTATISKEHTKTKWFDINEIEYVIQQPLEDAFALGLPIYYQQDGWQEVNHADITYENLYLSGHFKIKELTSKRISSFDYYDRFIGVGREFNITCVLLADGYSQFRISLEFQDHIFEILNNIEDLNSLSPLLEFSKKIDWGDFAHGLTPTSMHALSSQTLNHNIVCSEPAIKIYCEKFLIKKYEERLEHIKNSALLNDSTKAAFTAPQHAQTTNHHENEPHKKSNHRNDDVLSTQGRNALTRTAIALAKCLVPELSDVPTNEQLNMLIKLMEDEHNDIPCDIKTLKKHLTRPD